jgi:ADP-ribosylglycohydrolase
MKSPSELLKHPSALADRASACLVGHAIGDSFGDAARSPENQFRFGITTDFPEGPAPGTDDTEFALLAAHTLINAGGELTGAHVLESWVKHVLPLQELKRGGASEREAAANIRRGVMPPLSGAYNSYCLSDGAAMRISPVGIVCAGDPVRAAKLARIEAGISHARDGVWGAEAIAAGIAVAMAGGELEEILQAGVDATPADSWMRFTLTKALGIVETSDTWEEAWVPLHNALWTEYKAAAPEAVASAFAVLKMAGGDFQRSIVLGGNFGRDADTIAAIAGALSGAHRGLDAIPKPWVEKVRIAAGACLPFTKGQDILIVAGQLAGLVRA